MAKDPTRYVRGYVYGVAALLLTGISLTACGSSTSDTSVSGDAKMMDIDGVQCIVWDSGSYAGGGISCNWEAYNASK